MGDLDFLRETVDAGALVREAPDTDALPYPVTFRSHP